MPKKLRRAGREPSEFKARELAFKRSVWQDSLDRAQQQVNAAIAEKTRHINALLKMPVTEAEIKAKTDAFAEKTRPAKNIFVDKEKDPKKRKSRLTIALDIKKGWFWHPIKTANSLLPIEIGMGIGRKTKAKQIKAYKDDLKGRAKAFQESGLGDAKKILEKYSQKVNAALEEFKQTGNQMRFERLVAEADRTFKNEFWGFEGPMVKYVAATGRKMAAPPEKKK